MGLHPDFRDLLRAFDAAEARYLLVGGYAVAFHARPRFTKDIDLWIGEDAENLERVRRALAAFGAPPHVLAALEELGPDEILYMGAPPLRVDVFRRIPGVDFDDAWARRVEAEWDGVPIRVISLEDLVAAKEASGRPQDLEDARALRRARNGG